MSKHYSKPKKNNQRKRQSAFLSTISFFLLSQEGLRKLFWNVKSVRYDIANQTLEIGVGTIIGKLGTTLKKLRSHSKYLSDYLFEQGLTYHPKTKIQFFVDKQDEKIIRIYDLLDNTIPASVEEGVSL